jgi:hypothetical protein
MRTPPTHNYLESTTGAAYNENSPLEPVYTMENKSDHGRWPFSIVQLHGPIS